MRSLYSTLGVARRASRQDIKRAYYAAAHDCHPDKYPDDPQAAQRFRDISLAYTVLGDPASRKRYDLLGPMALGLSPSLTDLSLLGPEGEQLAQALGSVVKGVMGRLRRRTGKRPKTLDVFIDVAMALRGGSQQLHMERTVACPDCGGHRRHPRGSKTPGQALTARCGTCRGTGTVSQKVTWQLRIPQDSAPGDLLRMGQAGSMGEDIVLRLCLDPHPLILCRGLDLYIDLPLHPSVAALGGALEVRLPHKTLVLTLPPGSQSGHQLHLEGEGLRGGRLAKRGQLHLTLEVEMPVALNAQGKEAWLQVAREERDSPASYPKHEAFVRGMQG